MTFQQELDKLTEEITSSTQPYVLQAFEEFIYHMKSVKLAKKSLCTGEKAGNFSLPDAWGRNVKLSALLNNGRVLICFYRGGWCPYSKLDLQYLQRVSLDFQQAGIQIIAVSPEKPEHCLVTTKTNNLAIPLLSDLNSEVIRKFGISFKVPAYHKFLYRTFGLNLEKHNDTRTVELPISAVFLIDTDFTVRFAYVDEDYRNRLDYTQLLTNMKTEFVLHLANTPVETEK